MTVNVGMVDLGEVDLLVQEGFRSIRSDVKRTPLPNQQGLHADLIQQNGAPRAIAVGGSSTVDVTAGLAYPAPSRERFRQALRCVGRRPIPSTEPPPNRQPEHHEAPLQRPQAAL